MNFTGRLIEKRESRGNMEFKVGEIIKAVRQSKHQTREKVARESEMTQNALYFIEQGKSIPTMNTLFKLTKTLGLSIYITDGETNWKVEE